MKGRALPNYTLAYMKKHRIPITRENYLAIEYMGNPPEEPLDGEIEAELPPSLQRESGEFRRLLTYADKKLLRQMGVKRR